MDTLKREEGVNVNVLQKEQNVSSSALESFGSSEINVDDFLECGMKITAELKKNVQQFSKVKTTSTLVQMSELNNFLHSTVLPLLILFLILYNYKRVLKLKNKLETNDLEDAINAKEVFKEIMKKLEEIERSTYVHKDDIDKLTQQIIRYNKMVDGKSAEQINMDIFHFMVKEKKVLTFFNKPNLQETFEKITRHSQLYYKLLTYLQGYISPDPENKERYEKRYLDFIKEFRKKEPRLAKIFEDRANNFMKLHDGKNDLETRRAFAEERFELDEIKIACERFFKLSEKLNRCKSRHESDALMPLLYEVDDIIAKRADEFMYL